MTSFAPLFLAYAVFLGALASPGPDFLIVMRNALGFSARLGVATAAGIAAGLVFHMAYCVVGIGFIIARSPLLFAAVKWAGAAYLVYLGMGALRSKGETLENGVKATEGKTAAQAFRDGLITNLFNPKATMFFLALFSQMVDPQTPLLWLAVFCAGCILTAFIWFSFVAALMGIPRVRAAYSRASRWIDRVFGVFFIALGAKLALAKMG